MPAPSFAPIMGAAAAPVKSAAAKGLLSAPIRRKTAVFLDKSVYFVDTI